MGNNETKHPMSCFGEYYDDKGYPCEYGESGCCKYNEECQIVGINRTRQEEQSYGKEV